MAVCLQDHMTCVEGDLSGKKLLNVHMWVKMGQGDGVVTGIRVQKAPTNRANSALAKVPTVDASDSECGKARAIRLWVFPTPPGIRNCAIAGRI